MKSPKKQEAKQEFPVSPEVAQSGATSELEVAHPIADRLYALKGALKLNEFARKCDIRESLMRKYLGGAMPGADKAAKIAAANNVSIEWLVTGDNGGGGENTLLAHSATLAQELRARYDATEAFALVPLYDVRAAAGHGALADDLPAKESWAFSRAWLAKSVGVSANRLKLVTVSGDSMEPDLHDGDVVMIDVADVEVLREGVYVFSLGGHVYVKRLVLHDDKLIIISRNRDLFPPMSISTMRDNSTFRLIGRVVGQPTFRRF